MPDYMFWKYMIFVIVVLQNIAILRGLFNYMCYIFIQYINE